MCFVLVDPATADDEVVVIEDDGLSWRDGDLGCIEVHAGAGAADGADRGGGGLMPMSDLRMCPDRRGRLLENPVHP